MIQMNSQQLQACLPSLSGLTVEFEFTGVEIDSRKPCNGSLFVAIRGENFDGHDFVDAAVKKGAVAVVVEKDLPIDIPQIRVEDCKIALAKIATAWRRQLDVQIVAVTGSNGKTTVKEMLGQILSNRYPALMTAGNLNNDIGVPLTLFRLAPQDRFAVVEMGANHVDEIRQLVSIAEPDVVYVNNAREAHVEGFGSLRNVVIAKGEMYRYCKADALAVFNDDEVSVTEWKSTAATPHHLVFSMQHDADVTASFEVGVNQLQMCVQYQNKQASCELNLLGSHNAQNALAAITLALACGLTLKEACQGMNGFSGVAGRQQSKRGPRDSLIIDDSYNANPDSLAAAVDVLCSLPGSPWLALGDMAELGAESQALHDQAARNAKDKGVLKFFALGDKACHASHVFGENGFCFTDHETMATKIRSRLNADVNLLVKGSRSAHMEKLVEELAQQESKSGERHAV